MQLFSNLLFHEFLHLLFTSVVAFYLYSRYRDFRLVIISFLIGFFIDLDHLIDYFNWSNWRFSFWEFINPPLYVQGSGKVLIFLHGWEFLLVLFIIGKRLDKKLPGIMMALILPYFFHLIIDQIHSAGSIFSYFFLYRTWHGFSMSAFNRIFR